MIPVIRVNLPNYLVHPASAEIPDAILKSAGEEIAAELERNFAGKRVLLRLLSSSEHPGKTPKELIAVIRSLGHDRYDPSRKGDRYDNLE